MRSATSTRWCYLVFVACICGAPASPVLWGQSKKGLVAGSASFPIGKYILDMPIEGMSGLTEFSQAEYVIFGRRFDGERNFNAPALDFLQRRWKVALGTVGGRVYKIALYFETEGKDTAIDASTDVMQYCQQRLGKPSVQQETSFVWDASDGNVVLQLGKVGSTYMINLFETSRGVRTLAPKR